MALGVLGALLLPGAPSLETGLCGSGAVVPGRRGPLSPLLAGGISAPQTGTGATAPERRRGRLAELLDSDQLLYRRRSALTRRRRNILFPGGVKLCTQETFDQAAATHLTFFQHRGESQKMPFLAKNVRFSDLQALAVDKGNQSLEIQKIQIRYESY